MLPPRVPSIMAEIGGTKPQPPPEMLQFHASPGHPSSPQLLANATSVVHGALAHAATGASLSWGAAGSIIALIARVGK